MDLETAVRQANDPDDDAQYEKEEIVKTLQNAGYSIPRWLGGDAETAALLPRARVGGFTRAYQTSAGTDHRFIEPHVRVVLPRQTAEDLAKGTDGFVSVHHEGEHHIIPSSELTREGGKVMARLPHGKRVPVNTSRHVAVHEQIAKTTKDPEKRKAALARLRELHGMGHTDHDLSSVEDVEAEKEALDKGLKDKGPVDKWITVGKGEDAKHVPVINGKIGGGKEPPPEIKAKIEGKDKEPEHGTKPEHKEKPKSSDTREKAPHEMSKEEYVQKHLEARTKESHTKMLPGYHEQVTKAEAEHARFKAHADDKREPPHSRAYARKEVQKWKEAAESARQSRDEMAGERGMNLVRDSERKRLEAEHDEHVAKAKHSETENSKEANKPVKTPKPEPSTDSGISARLLALNKPNIRTQEEAESAIQMYDDLMETRRWKNEAIPQSWIDGRAAIKAALTGDSATQGAIHTQAVFGHPEHFESGTMDDLVPYGTVPIRVGDKATAERKLANIQDLYTKLNETYRPHEFMARQKETPSNRAKVRASKAWLQKNGNGERHQRAIEGLQESRKEMHRVINEFEKRAAEKATKDKPSVSTEKPQQSGPANPSPHGTVKFNFGHHAGKTIAEVHATDPDHVQWAAEKSKQPALKEAAQKFLADQSPKTGDVAQKLVSADRTTVAGHKEAYRLHQEMMKKEGDQFSGTLKMWEPEKPQDPKAMSKDEFLSRRPPHLNTKENAWNQIHSSPALREVADKWSAAYAKRGNMYSNPNFNADLKASVDAEREARKLAKQHGMKTSDVNLLLQYGDQGRAWDKANQKSKSDSAKPDKSDR